MDSLVNTFVAQIDAVASKLQAALSFMNQYNAMIANTIAVGMPAGSNLNSTVLQTNLLGSSADIENQRVFCVNNGMNAAFYLTHASNSPYYGYPPSATLPVPIPAPVFQTYATATDVPTNTVFTAVNAGTAGNSIALVFDGIEDVTTVVATWNGANATNTVSFTGTGTSVITAQTITLTGGTSTLESPPIYTAPAVVT